MMSTMAEEGLWWRRNKDNIFLVVVDEDKDKAINKASQLKVTPAQLGVARVEISNYSDATHVQSLFMNSMLTLDDFLFTF
jgi:hypothetical protein